MAENQTTITMERIDDHVNFKATNATGNTMLMDGSEAIGGKGNGIRPMETLLMGVAGCSTIDIVLILKKMKQTIDDIRVEVTADRIKVEDATQYSKIHVHYLVSGDIKESKLQKAISLSLEKYCSVSKMLEKTSEITSSYALSNPATSV